MVSTGERRWGGLHEGSQMAQTSSYRMNKQQDIMYNMNTINTAVCCIWKLFRELNLRVLVTRKKIFSIDLIVHLYEMTDAS